MTVAHSMVCEINESPIRFPRNAGLVSCPGKFRIQTNFVPVQIDVRECPPIPKRHAERESQKQEQRNRRRLISLGY